VAQVSARLGYEEPDKSARIYTVEFADPKDAIGTWTIVPQPGNQILIQTEAPPPMIDSFTACDTTGTCLDMATPLTLEQDQSITMNWNTHASTKGLTVNVYATNTEGKRSYITTQRTDDQTALQGTMTWKPVLANGTYTVSLELEADGNAPISLDKGVVTIHDTTPPAAPAGLTAQTQIDLSTLLAWDGTAAPADLAGYQFTIDGGEPIMVDGPINTYTLYGFEPGSSHTVSVAAYDLSGNTGPAATVTTAMPKVAVNATWPRRNAALAHINEVGASFAGPVSILSFTVADGSGSPAPGSMTLITSERSVTEIVTLGAVYRPSHGELPPGTYTATIEAQDRATGTPISLAWSFQATPAHYQQFVPFVERK
jgi:hypothetical protein